MEKLFYKMPSTIGEELRCQIEYKKMQDKSFNYSTMSRKIKDQFIQDLGFERKDDDENVSTRPAMINELFDIGRQECTPKYMYLFMAFKSLGIIKDDIVILQMLKDYEITPKKDVDKNNLQNIQQNLIYFKNPPTNTIFYKGIDLCTKCKDEKTPCGYTQSCIYVKIYEKMKKLSVMEQINYLYNLGLPTTFKKAPVLYTISIQTLKNILENLNLVELKERVKNIENKYINKLNYDNELKERTKHRLKKDINAKKNNIKYYKNLDPALANMKKEKIKYLIEKEQQKLEFYQKEYEHIKSKNNIGTQKYNNMLNREIKAILYVND